MKQKGLILSNSYESVGCNMDFTAVRKNKSVPKTIELLQYQHVSTNHVHIYVLTEISSHVAIGSYK